MSKFPSLSNSALIDESVVLASTLKTKTSSYVVPTPSSYKPIPHLLWLAVKLGPVPTDLPNV